MKICFIILTQDMGTCAGGNSDSKYQKIKSAKSAKFKKMELDLIELMYLNLSKRCRNNLVTRETFDLFFHSSGLIGEILFLKFDHSKKGTISFQQFLAAFQLMMKGSLRERADILFEIYDVHNTGGVKYDQLLKILFSYNIEELNKMFVEEKFLKFIGQGQLNYYFGAQHKKIEEKIILEEEDGPPPTSPKREKITVPSSVVLHKVEIGLDRSAKNIQNERETSSSKKNDNLSKKFAPKDKPQKVIASSSLIENMNNFKGVRKNLKIRSNIASLTKKYANYLFDSAGLNKEKDFFSKENFFKLIQEHPSLFNAYLSGFHTYIWQVGDDDEPQYFKAEPWIESQATERYQGEEDDVYLKFIQKTVFVMRSKKKKMPKQIINLEGLTVDTIQQKTNDKIEYGIFFKHRDGLYEAKEYIFNDKSVYDEWIKHLADFRTTSMENLYTMLEKIGGGNYSSVYRGKIKKTGQEVAIKVIETFKLSVAQKEVLKRETGILKQCHHPNIIKFYDEFKTKTHIYIVTEILNQGDLFEYTKKNGFLQEYEAAIIFKHLIDAILYLNQELGIIHRDLKPENVLIKMNEDKKMVLKVKLIDFGFGVFKDKLKDLSLKEKFAGTPGFIAPEIYNAEQYDQKVDTFSLGIILYFMLSGQFPFHSPFLQEIEALTKACTISMVNNHWANISNEAKDLLEKILCFKDKRLTTKQVANHPWLKNIDKLKQYIGRNPKKTKGYLQ